MKNIIILTVLFLAGCSESKNNLEKIEIFAPKYKKLDEFRLVYGSDIEVFEYEGHKYFIRESTGGSITHLESCPCKTNLSKEYIQK